MSEITIPKFHSKQVEAAQINARFKVLNWGRRSGKSTFAFLYTYLKAVKHQGRYWIITRNAKQAKKIYWNDVAKTYLPAESSRTGNPGFKFNDTELTITFPYIKMESPGGNIIHDTNLPPSRIEFVSAEDHESLVGVGLDGIVVDEYSKIKDGKMLWDKYLRPTLSDKQGWAIFISTPDGIQNHFFDLVQKAQTDQTTLKDGRKLYFYSHATALDNPHFPKDEWDEVKKQYQEEGRMAIFREEYEAEFSAPEELVYQEFEIKHHVIQPEDVPADGTDILGIDFGYNDPFAAVFVRIDDNDNWYIYDEIYKPGLTMQKAESILHTKMAGRRFARIIGDGSAKFDIESMKKMNFRIVSSKKGADSIRAGIREVKAKLAIREGTGKPKLFVASNCHKTIREFQSYRNTRNAYDEVTDKPEDRNNHAMDALRYLALDRARFVNKRVKKQRKFDPVTGRMLS
jgi:phage terminase large subunit